MRSPRIWDSNKRREGDTDERRESSQNADPWAEFGGSGATRGEARSESEGDWECSDCGKSNFARRMRCFG